MIAVLPDFVPRFLSAVAVNFEIALLSLLLGLVLGAPLVMLQLGGRLGAIPAAGLVAALRAAPTFVVMFFLLNVLPRELPVLGIRIPLGGLTAVVLSLAIYAIAYVADNGLVAMRALQRGDAATALLFLPNVMRAFFVLVMASATAAAVGTPEAIFTTLREAERMPMLSERVILFGLVMLFFTAVLQAAFAAINLLRVQLLRRMAAAATAPAE